MFTVIITEKEHLDNIREYGLFLDPFIKKNQFAFCQWNPEEKDTIAATVPDLSAAVAHREQWRAIILCEEDGISLKNPFDIVRFDDMKRESHKDEVTGETVQEDALHYYRRCQKMQFEKYEEAAQRPFVQLVTRLCTDPSITSTKYEEQIRNKVENMKELQKKLEQIKPGDIDDECMILEDYVVTDDEWRYLSYCEGEREKQRIRAQIRGNERLSFTLPAEILCISRRTAEHALPTVLKSSWTDHDEMQYTSFQNANLYFEKMRYLVFDIGSKDKAQYTYDYIKFMYTVLMIAGNETPRDALTPMRVYRLDCDIDEEYLKQFLALYVEKLDATKDNLNLRIRDIEKTPEERLSDAESRRIFCSNIQINVVKPEMASRDDFAYLESSGLAGDCPVPEEGAWMSRYRVIKKNVHRLLKQPRRAVSSAADDVHRLDTLDEERAAQLNEFQIEDVQEHVSEEELGMVGTVTTSLYEEDYYYDMMDAAGKKVLTVMKKRMTRFKAVVIGLIVLGAALLSLVPLVLDNIGSPLYLIFALIILAAVLVLTAAVGIAALISLRAELRAEISDFNGVMNGICREVDDNMQQYARYLSHVCNVMRGYSVLDYNRRNGNSKSKKVMVLKKHVVDIEEKKAELFTIFGRFMDNSYIGSNGDVEAFDYDFDRTVDYKYPLPINSGMKSSIQFMQKGIYAEVPVRFIRKIELRREELYD